MSEKDRGQDAAEKNIDQPTRSQDAGGSCVGSTVPEWIRGLELWKTLDAKALVEGGGDLKATVLKDIDELPADKMYLVISPEDLGDFPDAARDSGFRVYADETNPGVFKAYIAR